jgi:hypothetical protein
MAETARRRVLLMQDDQDRKPQDRRWHKPDRTNSLEPHAFAAKPSPPKPIAAARRLLKHDPEEWIPVFGKDHAQTTS